MPIAAAAARTSQSKARSTAPVRDGMGGASIQPLPLRQTRRSTATFMRVYPPARQPPPFRVTVSGTSTTPPISKVVCTHRPFASRDWPAVSASPRLATAFPCSTAAHRGHYPTSSIRSSMLRVPQIPLALERCNVTNAGGAVSGHERAWAARHAYQWRELCRWRCDDQWRGCDMAPVARAIRRCGYLRYRRP